MGQVTPLSPVLQIFLFHRTHNLHSLPLLIIPIPQFNLLYVTTYIQLQSLTYLLLVHITGLQSCMGMRVWVRWVQVRVVFEIPVRNPHPYDGFGGFSRGTIILITATVQFMPHIFKTIFTVRTDLEVDYHRNGSGSIKTRDTSHNAT